jgi:Ca-activated chloride channel family protein
MVQQSESDSTIHDRQPVSIASSLARQPVLRRLWLAVFLLAAILPAAKAESPASKNKEGNRLFAEDRFEDAEKAYLEAQGKSPGKPEILYNLGNSLIKQKKYDPGIQSLRQSMNKGDRKIKENSWYNTGNAFFLTGKFKDSVEAYIQALKLNPSDLDAKHNLELALLALKQQESKQQAPNSDGNESRELKKQNEPMKSPSSPKEQREGTISPEQALQILDALKNPELEDQRKFLADQREESSKHRAMQHTKQKDW